MNYLEAIIRLLGATAGMFVVLGLWVAIQNAVRRYSGCANADKDVLEFMLRGCGGGCGGRGACHVDDNEAHLDMVEEIEPPVKQGAR
jgi:hypothetical protein